MVIRICLIALILLAVAAYIAAGIDFAVKLASPGYTDTTRPGILLSVGIAACFLAACLSHYGRLASESFLNLLRKRRRRT